MTAVFARMQVHALRLREAIARHWRRILVGAFSGWLGSTVVGALVLVWLESRGLVVSDESAALYAAAVVWGGTVVGALAAYSSRPHRRRS